MRRWRIFKLETGGRQYLLQARERGREKLASTQALTREGRAEAKRTAVQRVEEALSEQPALID